MKRINPKTSKPYEKGDQREDGYFFIRYRTNRTIKKTGYFAEDWSKKPVQNKQKYITSDKAKVWGSKRINPATNKFFKHGDIREDGFIFKCYQKHITKFGYLSEQWCSPDAWEKNKKLQAYHTKKNWVNYDPKIHHKRLNPETNQEFKIGDRDKQGRYFLYYRNGANRGYAQVAEYWADTYENFMRFYFRRTLSKIRQKCKKKKIPMNIDADYLISIFPENNLCPALQIDMVFGGDKKERFNSPSVDRIIPNKGYVKGNVRFVCYLANAIMNDANADEILKVGEWLKEQNVNRHEDR